MKKGVSLSIETIVILILAAAVLVALLFFFTDVMSRGRSDINTLKQKNDNCFSYVNSNPKCNSDLHATASSMVGGLEGVCKQLKYSACKDSLTVECVQQCCTGYCSGGTKGCRSLGGSCEVRPSCPNGEISEGTPDCQTISKDHKCCK